VTALLLVGKGTVVVEKPSTHCTLQVPFPLPLNALYYICMCESDERVDKCMCAYIYSSNNKTVHT
jgi:hypothetical protein